jgi:hypothetical protein
MPRPRYQINADDWLDILDWVEHQLNQPQWLTMPEHPVHSFGLSTLKDCVVEWRSVEKPSADLCTSAQAILEESVTIEDWGRMRKSLSARKRRRRDRRQENKSINITLTPNAHRALVEFRDLSGASTFSDAIENHLQNTLADLRKQYERTLADTIHENLKGLKASELIKKVAQYLELAQSRRSLANSCKIAYQLFMKRPEKNTLALVRDRFVEDLIWNELHLSVEYHTLPVFDQSAES